MKGILIVVTLVGLGIYNLDDYELLRTDSSREQSNRTSFLENNVSVECTPSEGNSGLCKITVGKYSSCSTRSGRASVNVDCKLYDELKRLYKEGNK